MGRYNAARGTRTRVAVRRAFIGALPLILATGMSTSASDPGVTAAVLEGRSIPLSEVSHLHCHDRDAPTIRCFSTSAGRDDDLDTAGSRSIDGTQAYVAIYADENYGGSSFTVYNPVSDLGVYGWNDCVSSFKSLNGQRPRLYSHIDYGTPAWRWAAGAWVSNVGGEANDATSSIKNDP